MKTWSNTRAILIGGAIAGALDIGFAASFAIYNGRTVERVLRIVASGALGTFALDGPAWVPVFGLACHFALSLLWASLFVIAARRMPALLARPWLTVPAYGLFVFLVMRLVVLPLSALPFPVKFNAFAWGMDLLSHIFLFALPILWASSKTAAVSPESGT